MVAFQFEGMGAAPNGMFTLVLERAFQGGTRPVCHLCALGVQSLQMPKILVVDDEQSIVDLLEYNLRQNGYQVVVASDGYEALQLARSEQPDLIILDLMLPGPDGFDVCRELRREAKAAAGVPIIMLTARDEEVDRVVGLELGADDYVTKPFSVRELMARVKAVLRRVGPAEDGASAVYRVGALEVDALAREARLQGALLSLTRLEFDLLETLARHAGQALTREQLLEQAWGYDYYGDARAVDSAVKRLRAKLRQAGADSEMLSTVRGVGYRVERS
jgi:DNA-binding response OmpR family regulator